MAIFKLKGDRTTSKVWLNDKELDLKKSLKVKFHSPSGFSWGYNGAGPKQLSLAILLEFYSKQWALDEYLYLLETEISRLPFDQSFEKEIDY